SGSVMTSLLLFAIVYNLLLVAFLYYGGKLVWNGPGSGEDIPKQPTTPDPFTSDNSEPTKA
ncbi:MAG: hypothetical protein R3360_02500, partial [Alphaproteobacteria bacterium]|nr:hypothetical protein [Alphaproteobacteria bacterium]